MLAVVLLLSVGQGPADAALTSTTANTANALTADTLQPPTGLTAAASGSDIQLDWTATPDTYAAGYNIYRSTTQGCCYTFLDSVVGQATVTYTDVGAGAPATVAPAYESIATATRNNAGYEPGDQQTGRNRPRRPANWGGIDRPRG